MLMLHIQKDLLVVIFHEELLTLHSVVSFLTIHVLLGICQYVRKIMYVPRLKHVVLAKQKLLKFYKRILRRFIRYFKTSISFCCCSKHRNDNFLYDFEGTIR